MVIIDQPQKNHRDTVVPRSYATPSYAKLAVTLFWIETKKPQFYFLLVMIFFPPFTLFSSFSPQLPYFLLFPPSYATFYVLEEKIA